MLLLLAQLVAPPLQNSPIRLPGPDAGEQRPAPRGEQQPVPVEIQEPIDGEPPAQTPDSPDQPGTEPPAVPGDFGSSAEPRVEGLTVYDASDLSTILAGCGAGEASAQRLQTCAAVLTARLVADGYLNSRVYVKATPAPGYLEVVEGRVVELRVNSDDGRLSRKVSRLLAPLKGSVLHLPTVEQQLQLLKRLPGVANVRGNLSRLGSDPSQAVFTVSFQPSDQPWQGEFSLRNDGSNGSGEARAIGTIAKANLATRGDTLLIYSELGTDNTPSLGAVITSVSYTVPLADQWNFTGAFGYSRRNLIELPSPTNGISTTQFQGLGQVEWVFKDTLSQRWSLFAGFSGDRSTTYLDGRALPDLVPESVRSPSNGYLRVGLAANGLSGSLGWAGNVYLLQGIAAATPQQQRKELAQVDLYPGEATALGGLISAAWAFAPSWQLNLRAGGQVAFKPLTNSMQFTVGSDAGIRGLPGQFLSGDNGWLGTAEVAWTFWQKNNQSLQLVPFIGMGGVTTTLAGVTFSDTVGSGGILARWLAGNSWLVELGWVEQFETNDNLGEWTDWALGKGLYAQVKYRF
ncbi:ShlB/FhaC/HecB family hemolysin secretion/activation protein [Synechococcus sp. CBW1002]|jgi:hemolysin activation/secretion protein|uniref:ShlB/FhaC/HecB family hemolysin secretion/activation protein n=1 Tax=Synechococcus sp. CBW1002 TaxID=1353134 RepID=UPI0018CD0F20|nr:ShlB/FhaC/HecB family hemolysin secretion/activation protein [Synechococcus sp. CBW1002]QPN60441.1 ShlB/FhaC/HecB family hemolysin secretion/activation protein [Synechococcus sp. CBW1002]